MAPPPDIIVADRSPEDTARLAERVRALGHTIAGCAHTADGLNELLAEHESVALLIATEVGGEDGLALAEKACRERPFPYVLLGEEVDEATTDRLTRMPAALFARKDASRGELRAALLIACATFQRWQELKREAESLETRLEHRKLIARAKGRIMEKRGMNEEQAYTAMRTTSQNRRISMAELAREIIEHGVEAPLQTTPKEHSRRP